MKTRSTILPILGAALITHTAFAQQGRVIEDSTGNPVASAELRFHKSGARELAADIDTDRQGRFNAEGLPGGEYAIEVLKPGYVTTSFRLETPAPALTLRLVRLGIIDGRATDPQGQPLPGRVLAPGGRTSGSSRITILTKDSKSGQLRSVREATLEEGGRYRIFDLAPGEYAVGFWYSGLKEGSGMQLYPNNTNPRLFTITGGEEYRDINFTVVPRPATSVSGKLAIPEGVKGQFQLSLGLPEQPLLPVAQALSEKDGSFTFEKIAPGAYDVFASGPVGGYGAFESILGRGVDPLFGRTRIQVSGQNVDHLDIPLAPAKSVRVLLQANGSTTKATPPPGCPAETAINLTSAEPWSILFFTNAEASFAKELSVPNLAPGKFRITATGLGSTCFQASDAIADLTSDNAGPVVIELAGAGVIHGVLHGDGAGAVVVITGAQTRVAYADSTGAFTFEGIPPARYRIAAYTAAEASRARWLSDKPQGREVDVTGGVTTTLELDAAPPAGGRPQ